MAAGSAAAAIFLSRQCAYRHRGLERQPAHAGGLAPKITAGGSFFISSGSRPTAYYQPIAKLWLPMGKKLNWFAEWRYFGYGEAFYLYEGFRTHSVTAGVRIMR